ncbi:MAG: hypothetical protein J6A01_02800 [Proteobacteria bacterium]|nr:hypothetical protein [Pseudomonadota bacterium]
MSKKSRLLAIICAFAGCMSLYGCSDSSTIPVNGGNPDEVTKPDDGTCKDGDENCKPADETCKEGDENCKPADETCEDGDENCKPADVTCEEGDENCKPADQPDPVDPETCAAPDEDGDYLSDEIEGRNLEDDSLSRDTDNDTIPDYKDPDSDGDYIPDSVEGGVICSGEEPVNRGYGNADYINADVDDNRISDTIECCGADESQGGTCAEEAQRDENGFFILCVDTNGDGTPDYISDDNDGDGTTDLLEIEGMVADSDKVGATQFSGDCDGNKAPDEKGSAENPIDCDKDGIFDYMDVDSDGDTILDVVEGDAIRGDYFARYSKDSDGDGIPDNEECRGNKTEINGVAYFTDCVDTDNDKIPDYLDIDSDSDGLSDEFEHKIGSDPTKEDSDGDGASDLVEYGAGSNPTDANDNPQSKGNFVFVVPYKKESSPKKQSLSFETAVQTVDIYFSIDTSGSMSGEINTIRDKLPSMLEKMRCKDLGKDCQENKDCAGLDGGNAICSEAKRCIVNPNKGTDGKGCFADMWTGIGWWGNINRFENAVSLQPDPQKTVDAAKNPGSHGGKENNIQPGACVAEGTKHCTNTDEIKCYSGNDRVGCVGYRKDAIKIYIQAGDEKNYESNETTYTVANAAITGKALRDKKIRYVGLWGEYSSDKYAARDGGIKQVACEAGSCAAGTKCAKDCQKITDAELAGLYLAKIDDSSIETQTIEIVRKLAKGMDLHITSGVDDIDVPNVKKLVKELKVNTEDSKVQGRECTKVSGVSGAPYEEIAKLAPGTSVCYDVIPVDSQDIFPATSEPQVFKARIKVMGDGSVLNSGIAYFLVPPVLEEGEEIN